MEFMLFEIGMDLMWYEFELILIILWYRFGKSKNEVENFKKR